MQYTILGKTGITVSRICLGCMSYGGGEMPDWAIGTKGWHVNKEDAREHFKIALDAGINFFDTADVYSVGVSEEITGAHLKEMASRDDIVVATKVHGAMGTSPNKRGLSRKHIIEAARIRCAAWAWTTSTSIRSIAGISIRRSKKRWTRWIRWCGPAKFAIWAQAAWRRGSSRRRSITAKEHGWHRFVACRITTIWSIAKKNGR